MKPAVSPRTYFIVCVALLCLVALTATLAYVNLGPFNGPVALTIAVIKALLILLFFMHIRVSSSLIRFASGLGFAWLLVLFTLSLSDYVSRGAIHVPGK
jgi:cytochrome c oxidase subunit IV